MQITGLSSVYPRPAPAIGASSSVTENTSSESAGPSESSAKPATATEARSRSRSEQKTELLERAEIDKLARRDREVRAHEQAHAAVGGAYAGAPSYSYTRGPDGKNYATAGEVPIDTAPVAGDPQATIAKMQLVRRAALAPAQPSGQDRVIAAQAQAQIIQAQGELLANQAKQDEAQAEQSPQARAALASYQAVSTETEASGNHLFVTA